jgi:2-hydroxychromene-2-carboxylate isomerase
MRLDFYFDFLSPYAFLAWKRLSVLSARDGLELGLHPILFAGLLKRWGQLGPAEIPPKREFAFRDVFRFAARHGIPMTLPATHPFNPVTALRAALPLVAGDRQAEVVDALFSLAWQQGGDLGSAEAVRGALDALGLDGAALLANASSVEAKETLRAATLAAAERGVFGVPSYLADGELFWGNDRLDDALAKLRGEDPLDTAAFQRALDQLPGGARRTR